MRNFITIFCGIYLGTLAFAAPIEIGIGAKSQGMGGAFVGVANDATATYWNPGGLGAIKEGEIRFMHWILSDVANINIEWISLTYPLPTVGTVGVAWLCKMAKLEQGRDTTKNSIVENTYSISYGFPIWKIEDKGLGLFVGGALNRFSINSDIGSSSGVGFDASVLWIPKPILRIGFIARNLSANMGDENFPTTYRAGFALIFNKFTIAVDVSTKEGVNGKNGLILHYFGGLEFKLVEQFAIRAGGNDIDLFTAGAGFKIKRMILDYSYSGMKEEGLTNSHRIELGYAF